MTKKQLNVKVTQSFKQTGYIKRNQTSVNERETWFNNLTFNKLTNLTRLITFFILTLFIIAYCQQNRYVRLAIYTDIFPLMNILNKNFYNYFVTERSRNNTLYRKFLLNCKQHSKTRKELNLKKELNLN